MNGPVHGKSKEGFGWQTKAPYDDGTSKRGDLYFKSGKDACMSSNIKALHTYFYSLQENPQKEKRKKESSKIERKREKKRIIELIIKENHCCDLGTERK